MCIYIHVGMYVWCDYVCSTFKNLMKNFIQSARVYTYAHIKLDSDTQMFVHTCIAYSCCLWRLWLFCICIITWICCFNRHCWKQTWHQKAPTRSTCTSLVSRGWVANNILKLIQPDEDLLQYNVSVGEIFIQSALDLNAFICFLQRIKHADETENFLNSLTF